MLKSMSSASMRRSIRKLPLPDRRKALLASSRMCGVGESGASGVSGVSGASTGGED